MGPGLITGAADDDPSGIATYSQTGAQFGYAMCWVMLFCFPLMAAIQEICARIGRTTGRGIAGNIRAHYPGWLLYGIVGLLLLANTINLGADLGAMAAALKLLIGGPANLYVVGFAVGCTWLEVFSRYERYVSILKWGSFVLLAYVAVALVVPVPWALVSYSLFVPSFSLRTDYIVTVVAVLGTTISPYCFFWQSSQEAEDERVDPTAYPLIDAPEQGPAEISRMRWDTYVGMGYSNVISLFIIVATAATLNAHGITDIQTSAQAAEALRPIAGVFTFALFAAGIIVSLRRGPPSESEASGDSAVMWTRRSCPLIDDGHYRRCRTPGCKARMAASAGDGLGRLIRSNGSSRRALRPADPLRRWRAVMV